MRNTTMTDKPVAQTNITRNQAILLIEGFRTELRELRRENHKFTADQAATFRFIRCGVKALGPTHKGLTVALTEDGWYAVRRAVCSHPEFQTPSKTPAHRDTMALYEETQKMISGIYYPGHNCQYCGRKADPDVLMTNKGACHRPACVLSAMRDHL